jgi:hypothetical protein
MVSWKYQTALGSYMTDTYTILVSTSSWREVTKLTTLYFYLNFEIQNWIPTLSHFKSYYIYIIPHFIFQTHSFSSYLNFTSLFLFFSFHHFFLSIFFHLHHVSNIWFFFFSFFRNIVHLRHISNLSYCFSFSRDMFHRLKGRTQVKVSFLYFVDLCSSFFKY